MLAAPPTYNAPPMPAPPTTVKAPLLVLVLAVDAVAARDAGEKVPATLTLPPTYSAPAMPTPPPTMTAPVVVLVLAVTAALDTGTTTVAPQVSVGAWAGEPMGSCDWVMMHEHKGGHDA